MSRPGPRAEAAARERREELSRLRSERAEKEREAEDRERQLDRYAADLRATFMEERVRARELQDSYVATVAALTNAVEFRDAYTRRHAERVTAYGLEIARRVDPKLAADPQVEFGFLLHDIGKVAVPDAILHKREPLTVEEREVIEQHPLAGWRILAPIEYLSRAREVVRHHHERWDGSGYPDGLAGDRIPLAARVFAVADAFDAMTTDRPYVAAESFAAARKEIERCSGTHFDPAVVEAFGRIADGDLERIREGLG
jgi:HD-GYP domain-containing protein (c-di-GMP phosphodiesterase class II)